MRTPKLPACSGVLAMLLAGPAVAQDFQPYPEPRITAEQYARYADQVLQAHGYSTEILKDQKLIAFSDQRTRTFRKYPSTFSEVQLQSLRGGFNEYVKVSTTRRIETVAPELD